MKNPIRVSSFALAALLLTGAACGDPTRSPSLALAPSARAFALSDKGWVTVGYTLTNIGATTASIEWRCGDQFLAVVEQRTAAGWENYAGGMCNGGLASSVPLPGGTSRQGSVVVFDPGQFRLITMVDGRKIVSARFTVE